MSAISVLNVLVIGRDGQVARALARTVPADGVRLTCLGRPELDIRQPDSVGQAIGEVAPDLVINAAAYTAVDQAESEPEQAFEVNAIAAGGLARAAAARGIPVFHLSTDYVFDGQKQAPYKEDDRVAPLGTYGRSKLDGEMAVLDANPAALVLRTAWVYSPWGKNFARTMLSLAETRDEISVVHDQIGTPTSALDIARGLWALALGQAAGGQAPAPGIFHMTARGEASWAEFAEEIFAVSLALGGASARIRRIGTADYPTLARRPANSRLDSSRLLRVHGVALPDWRASVRPVVTEIVQQKGLSL